MTNEEINRMRNQALEWGLLSADCLCDYSTEELQQICNGIGPDCFPPDLREFIDKLNPTLRIAAMIHDVRFYRGDGNWGNFLTVNEELAVNGSICAMLTYKWYDPRRYIVQNMAQTFRKLCNQFGWNAYQAAIRQRKQREGTTDE